MSQHRARKEDTSMDVAPGIYSMMQRQGVLVHAYLVDTGDGLILIDTLYGAAGNLAFYWTARRALFAGDTLVTWPDFAPGWPGFMLNFRQNDTSMHRMAELNAQVLCCGHGDPLRADGGERLHELLARLDKEKRP